MRNPTWEAISLRIEGRNYVWILPTFVKMVHIFVILPSQFAPKCSNDSFYFSGLSVQDCDETKENQRFSFTYQIVKA